MKSSKFENRFLNFNINTNNISGSYILRQKRGLVIDRPLWNKACCELSQLVRNDICVSAFKLTAFNFVKNAAHIHFMNTTFMHKNSQ